MDERLQHDPRSKTMIKDMLFDFLYAPTIKQFRARLEGIITKNCQLTNNSTRAFHYKGEHYISHDAVLPVTRLRLDPSLAIYMDQYVIEQNQLNNYELPYVVGFLTAVLNSSNELQDYLKVFPDAVHRPLSALIAQCPCKTSKLSADMIIDLQIRNQVSINLMKQRLMTNLLI